MRQIVIAVFLLALDGPVQGQTGFYAIAGQHTEIETNSGLTTAHAGTHVFAGRALYFGLGAVAVKFWSPEYSEAGIGIQPSAGFAFVNTRALKVYMEVSGGMVYMFPERKENIRDFIFSVGPYFYLPLGKKIGIKGGAGFLHFPNGSEKGYSWNNTWDGAGISAGIIF